MSKLQEVRNLLAKPEAWLQGEYSDSDANPTCFCIIGALNHSYAGPDIYDKWLADVVLLNSAIALGADYTDATNIIEWNDNEDRTHEQVLMMLDIAIANGEIKNAQH